VGAITFDDAYVDNLITAKPILDALDLPATVFTPTGWINESRPMWWDRLAHAVLVTPELPETLDLHTQERDFSWHAPEVNAQGPSGRRCRKRLHRAFWSTMRELADDDARHDVMDCLVQRLGSNETPVTDARPMTNEELEALSADGRIRLGAHAVSHPSLPGLDRQRKAWEIEHSAEQCRQLTGKRPATFAYPFGDLDEESVELVRASGYTLACTTREDLFWEGEDPYLLPRIAVGNWRPREFHARLNWYWLA
jgi:peptidoglycan/xylan/chitin deacetylase (PgdA/CDA1 family)